MGCSIKRCYKLTLFLELMLVGCTTPIDTEHYHSMDEASNPENKRLVVRRKRYATGIGSQSYDKLRNSLTVSNVSYIANSNSLKYEPYSRIGNSNYTVNGEDYEVWTDIENYQEIGIASWYGPGFHGEKTSNGETYDQKGISAAHKNLPLPSYVKVTNLENNKTLIVRVNDRGPFHEGRIIDLSEGAAIALDVVSNGTAKVKVELIKVPEPPNAKELYAKQHSRYIQIVASNDLEKANKVAEEIRKKFSKSTRDVFVKQYTGMFKVFVGPFLPKVAEIELNKLKNNGYADSYLLYLD